MLTIRDPLWLVLMQPTLSLPTAPLPHSVHAPNQTARWYPYCELAGLSQRVPTPHFVRHLSGTCCEPPPALDTHTHTHTFRLPPTPDSAGLSRDARFLSNLSMSKEPSRCIGLGITSSGHSVRPHSPRWICKAQPSRRQDDGFSVQIGGAHSVGRMLLVVQSKFNLAPSTLSVARPGPAECRGQ